VTDHEQIREVVYRYARGIDRRHFELVRSCYHPNATDDHGDYSGGVDGFIEFLHEQLERWAVTSHFIGNVHIEIDGDWARVESYAQATHRGHPRPDGSVRDLTSGARYVDDFERRGGEWRIARRVVVNDWNRVSLITDTASLATSSYAQPGRFPDDPVFAPRSSA